MAGHRMGRAAPDVPPVTGPCVVPAGDAPGMISGIVGAVVVALGGALSSFIAYQKKKWCFKGNGEGAGGWPWARVSLPASWGPTSTKGGGDGPHGARGWGTRGGCAIVSARWAGDSTLQTRWWLPAVDGTAVAVTPVVTWP